MRAISLIFLFAIVSSDDLTRQEFTRSFLQPSIRLVKKTGTILRKLRPKEWADSLGAAVEEGFRDEFELVENFYDACRSDWRNSVFE